MSWPYVRRDMYYAPAAIPASDRHRVEVSGLTPWASGVREGLINFPFCHASSEGGPRNGVRTAVEDFLYESPRALSLFAIPVNHGIGLIYEVGSPLQELIATWLMRRGVRGEVGRMIRRIGRRLIAGIEGAKRP